MKVDKPIGSVLTEFEKTGKRPPQNIFVVLPLLRARILRPMLLTLLGKNLKNKNKKHRKNKPTGCVAVLFLFI